MTLIALCTLHQPRHVRVLAWLDPDRTRGATVSRGKGMLVEIGIFNSCQWHDHLGEE